jgi:hypothetical protein
MKIFKGGCKGINRKDYNKWTLQWKVQEVSILLLHANICVF